MGLLDVLLGSLGGLNSPQQGNDPRSGGPGGGLGDVLGGILGGSDGISGGSGGAAGTGGGAGGAGSGLGGLLAGAGPAVLMQIVAALMANRGGGGGAAAGGGGLGELLERFRGAGFGAQADSWVHSGQNMPISPGDLGQVLGDDVVGGLAQHTGMAQGDLLEQLSRLLPQAVDRVTPDGQLPDAGVGDIGDILRRFG